MNIQKQEFKKLAAKIGFDLHEEDGVFFYEEVKMAFELFLAIKAQAIPEGFVLVPKELSDQEAQNRAEKEFNRISSCFYMEHRSEPDQSIERLKRIWFMNKVRNLKVFYKTFIEAQEQSK